MKTQTHRIPEHVAGILALSTVSGLTLKLPPDLERRDYLAVMKVIELAGGRWDRQAGLHTFAAASGLETLGLAVVSGSIVDSKKTRQAFYTPHWLAERIAEIGCVSGCRVLEPSAGDGRLMSACLDAGAEAIQAVEIDGPGATALAEKFPSPWPVRVLQADFLKVTPMQFAYAFEAVVMNPPFTRGQDLLHVNHALRFLKPGGRLVAIMAGNDKTTNWKKFRKALDMSFDYDIERLPAGSFSESGTDVSTLILTVRL